MFNLNNDVLNRERRKLFPKINTISHRLSLYSLNILKNQKPFKFYQTFYKKYFLKKNKIKREPSNNSQILSLISRSRNYFFTLPINFYSSNENYSSKYNQDIELNKLEKKVFNSFDQNKNQIAFNKSEIFYIDFLKNKHLKNLQNNLIRRNTYNIKNMAQINNSVKLLRKNKRNKSCADIIIDKNSNNKYENDISKNNEKLTNIIPHTKRSQEQQTDESQFIQNIDNNIINKEQESKNNEIYTEKCNQKQKDIKKKENKFYINLGKIKRNKKEQINSVDNKYIKIYWNNLRRPICINSSKFIDIKPS